MAKSCFLKEYTSDGCRTIRNENNECNTSIGLCKNEIDAYHSVCDRVWKLDPSSISRLDKSQIMDALQDARVCYFMRQNHQYRCVDPRCQDAGHIGAVEKIGKIINLLSQQLKMLDRGILYPSYARNHEEYVDSFARLNHMKKDTFVSVNEVTITLDIPGDLILVGYGSTVDEAYEDLYYRIRDRYVERGI